VPAAESKSSVSGVYFFFTIIAVRPDGIAEVVGSNPTRSISSCEEIMVSNHAWFWIRLNFQLHPTEPANTQVLIARSIKRN
jgi:hypothetical protein